MYNSFKFTPSLKIKPPFPFNQFFPFLAPFFEKRLASVRKTTPQSGNPRRKVPAVFLSNIGQKQLRRKLDRVLRGIRLPSQIINAGTGGQRIANCLSFTNLNLFNIFHGVWKNTLYRLP